MLKEKSSDSARAMKYALWLLGRRNHSVKEIRQKLGRNYDAAASDTVIEKLLSLKMLDDERFAGEWAEYRLGQKKSRNFVLRELARKGIGREQAQGAVSGLNVDERANAYGLLKRKMKQYEKLEPQKKRDRIFRFLASRGFDFDVIEDASRKLLEGNEDE